MAKGKYRRKSVDARQSKQIYKNTKAIKQLRKPQEMKWVDISNIKIAPVFAGSIKVLNGVIPWDTEPSLSGVLTSSNETRLNSREGNQIVCKRYQFKGILSVNLNPIETVTNLNDVCRVRIMYLWINSPHVAVLYLSRLLSVISYNSPTSTL